MQYTHRVVENRVQIVVEFHYNQAAKQAGRRPLKGAVYEATEAAVNAFTGTMQNRCYSWLKTQPEFTGATDV
jgi:NADP-dependent 3-hydroxy acid dehydrogenase YdfG